MKYKIHYFMIVIILLVNLKIGITQCPEQGVPVLATQEMVDSFLAIYPNCEYIEGTMSIDNVPVYWVKEEPEKYLLTLAGILVLILGFLKVLFWKVSWFHA